MYQCLYIFTIFASQVYVFVTRLSLTDPDPCVVIHNSDPDYENENPKHLLGYFDGHSLSGHNIS